MGQGRIAGALGHQLERCRLSFKKTLRIETGLESGGVDEGAPGLRSKYNANYCGAFVRAPDGNKIEAVTHSAR